ncbi:MAG: acyltransferase family protein, partial [Mycetocola sp.]
QWVGDVSYSLYLWHWPLLVIAPYALDRDLGIRSRLAILAASFVLAWATKLIVEDPARKARILVRRPAWVTLAATVTATLLILGASGVGYVRTGNDIAASAAAAEQQLERDKACAGAMAAVADSCPNPYAPNELTNPALAATDIGKGVQVKDECKQTLEDSELLTCAIGDVSEPATTVALIGDSHAGHFLEALDLYGKDHEIRFITYLKTWCAGTGAVGVAPTTHGTPAGTESCAEWGTTALDSVANDPTIQAAVFSNFTQSYAVAAENGAGRTVTAEDYERAWQQLSAAGKQVIALRDIPNAGTLNVPDCIAQHPDTVDPCTIPITEAGLPASADPMLLAADANATVDVIDLYDVFCDDSTCHTLIGGLVAYFGSHHMTATFARTLAPIVGERISATLL